MDPEQTAERTATWERAKARAIAMGHRRPDPHPTPTDPTEPAAVRLPTRNPAALRVLLNRGDLTPEQAAYARRLFAAVAKYVREDSAA